MKSLAAVTLRVVLVLGVLAMAGGVLWAGSIGDCGSVLTVAGLPGAGSTCTSQDKLYGNFSTDIPSTWSVNIGYATVGGGAAGGGYDIHTITVNAPHGSLGEGPGGTYTFDYFIEIAPGSNPALYIDQVQVSANFSDISTPADNIDTKMLYNQAGTYIGSVTATNGANGNLAVYATYIQVDETITLDSTGFLQSFTDTFIEVSSPEPATMALMGAGLLGLGALLRRRKQV